MTFYGSFDEKHPRQVDAFDTEVLGYFGTFSRRFDKLREGPAQEVFVVSLQVRRAF
jgi:hypothetical protein